MENKVDRQTYISKCIHFVLFSTDPNIQKSVYLSFHSPITPHNDMGNPRIFGGQNPSGLIIPVNVLFSYLVCFLCFDSFVYVDGCDVGWLVDLCIFVIWIDISISWNIDHKQCNKLKPRVNPRPSWSAFSTLIVTVLCRSCVISILLVGVMEPTVACVWQPEP